MDFVQIVVLAVVAVWLICVIADAWMRNPTALVYVLGYGAMAAGAVWVMMTDSQTAAGLVGLLTLYIIYRDIARARRRAKSKS